MSSTNLTKTLGELRCPGRVSSSCSTWDFAVIPPKGINVCRHLSMLITVQSFLILVLTIDLKILQITKSMPCMHTTLNGNGEEMEILSITIKKILMWWYYIKWCNENKPKGQPRMDNPETLDTRHRTKTI